MPQLVKGGKWVFGWSRVGATGRVRIPPEAADEYGLRDRLGAIIVSGSRTSGGFVLMKPSLIEASPLGVALRHHPDLAEEGNEGMLREWNKRLHARVAVQDESFNLPGTDGSEYAYGLRAGDLLLVVRGSYVGPSFLSRGPLVEHAHSHGDLEVFE